MDIDFLIDGVVKRLDPLNMDALQRSKTKLFISATNQKTGEAEYFTDKDNIFEVLRASKAVPIFYGRRITIGKDCYIDGGISASLERNMQKAVDEGATKIIAIVNSDGSHSIPFWQTYSMFVHRQLRSAIRTNHINTMAYVPRNGVDTLTIAPQSLRINPLDNNRERVREVFNKGYHDVLENKELEKFLRE